MHSNVVSLSRSLTFGCGSLQTTTLPPTFTRRSLVNAVKAGKFNPGQYDVVLSSGFLAFAQHSGFLQAVENAGLEVAGVMGTSAGALTGSLYCAGYSPRQIAAELSSVPPINYLRPAIRPWEGGLLSFDLVVEKLRDMLPATFEELDREFAVGVVTKQGDYLIIDKGPLPEAVAASAAIPIIFQSVRIPGLNRKNPCKDGGIVDRVGLRGWRDRRREQLATTNMRLSSVPPCLVHVIQRSSNFSGDDNVDATKEENITTVYSAKAGVSLFNLGDFEEAFEDAVIRASPEMSKLSGLERPGKKWWVWGS